MRDPVTGKVGGAVDVGAWRMVLGRWWRSTRMWLAVHHWSVIAFVLATAVVLAFLGFAAEGGVSGPGDLLDAAYRTLGMAMLEDSPEPPVSWSLGVARFLLPVAVAWTAVTALYSTFRERFRLVLLPFSSGHVVVVGLGAMGLEFVRTHRRARTRVVAIEAVDGPGADIARAEGALVLFGDATNPSVLASAHVAKASLLVAATSSDRTNVEVVLTAIDASEGSKRLEMCLVHLEGPSLAPLLSSRSGGPAPELCTFTVHEHAARAILVRHAGIPGSGEEIDHLVLVGSSPLLGALAAEVAARSRRVTGRPARVTLVSRDPEADRRRWSSGDPQLAEHLDLDLVPTGVTSPLPDLPLGDGTVVVVDEGTDTRTLATALELRAAASATRSRVVACVGVSDSLQAAIDDERSDGFASLEAFDAVASVCSDHLADMGTPDGPVDACSVELLAQLAHEAYRRHRTAGLGEDGASPGDASLVPWSRLDEALKESNRAQVRDIPNKLGAVGCSAVPLSRWEDDDFEFTHDELTSVLGPMEHDRWWQERRMARWKHGSRDPSARSSPYMVPWDDLTEEIRQLDINAVAVVPRLLNAAGWRVVREEVPAQSERPPSVR